MTSSAAGRDYQARLLEALDRECEIFAALISVMEEKRRALVEVDLEPLEEICSREEELVGRLEEADRERHQAYLEAAPRLAPELMEPSLPELVETLAEKRPELAEELSRRHARLQELLVRVGELNFDNLVLTQNLLRYTRHLLDLVASGGVLPNYSPEGKVNPAQGEPRSLLERRA